MDDYELVILSRDGVTSVPSVRTYERPPSGFWDREAKLPPDSGDAQDYFGKSVDVSGNWAVISAYGDDESGSSWSGAAHIYRFVDPDWVHDGKLFHDVYVDGDFKATVSSRQFKHELTHISFAQLSDGAGTFYVDNVIGDSLTSISYIPTVSEWGLIVMTLLLGTAGTILLRRRATVAA